MRIFPALCLLLAGWSTLSLAAGTTNPPPAAATNAHHQHVGVPSHPAPTNALADARGAGFEVVDFDQLTGFTAALTLTPQGPEFQGRIPSEVLALSERRVAVAGMMMPLKLRDGQVSEFLLQKALAPCCQAQGPAINEWIIVRMNSGGVTNVTHRPVVAAGKLIVGEYHENGRLRAIYRMEGEQLFDRE
ncbi:MAG: DUF3299 domain-containing protein [Limisphaerales bacterium]